MKLSLVGRYFCSNLLQCYSISIEAGGYLEHCSQIQLFKDMYIRKYIYIYIYKVCGSSACNIKNKAGKKSAGTVFCSNNSNYYRKDMVHIEVVHTTAIQR